MSSEPLDPNCIYCGQLLSIPNEPASRIDYWCRKNMHEMPEMTSARGYVQWFGVPSWHWADYDDVRITANETNPDHAIRWTSLQKTTQDRGPVRTITYDDGTTIEYKCCKDC